MWYRAVVELGCVTPTTLCVKLKFVEGKVCVVVAYDPIRGGRKKRVTWVGFWIEKVIDAGVGRPACNVRDRVSKDITSAFDIP